jgi:signal transduction histidine kinase
MAKALKAGVSLQEGWRLRKDDSRFWASGHFISLWSAEGQQGFAKILRDLTERKHAADERERLTRELETRVERRTAELQEAVGELEAFSYSVSHDLRSPLRAMQGYAEALLEEAGSRLQEPEKVYLQRILNSSERLDRLISDVLAYSRISKAEIILKPIAIEWLLKEVINENPTLHPNQAEVRVEGPMPKALAHEASLTRPRSGNVSQTFWETP